MGGPEEQDPSVTAKLTSSFDTSATRLVGAANETVVNPSDAGRPAAPPGTASLPTIPDVRLEEILGRGGMGAVYRGRQIALDRPVAVKVVHPDLAKDESFVRRFEREAQVLARLSHPHIVGCYTYGRALSGEHYLLMEFVEGRDLKKQVQEKGPLGERDALIIARQVADALGHALDLGVIHRDVKPENILLKTVPAKNAATSIGVAAKLVDLGLASLARPDAEAAKITQAGTAVGTPVTMAPEQADAPDTIDHRADIYALGCTLYFAVTGKYAHEGDTVAQVIAKKFRDETPSPKLFRPGLSNVVVLLIERMMAYERERRPATYEELLGLLDGALSTIAPGSSPGASTGSGAVPVAVPGTPTAALAVKLDSPPSAPAAPPVAAPPARRASGPLVAVLGGVLAAAVAAPVAYFAHHDVGPEKPAQSPSPLASPVALVSPIAPTNAPSPAASDPEEPPHLDLDDQPKFFANADRLLEGWTSVPAGAWRPLDVNSDLNADLNVVLEKETRLASLELARELPARFAVKGEVHALNCPEVGVSERVDDTVVRFAIQPIGKVLALRLTRETAGGPAETIDSLAVTLDAPVLEVRFVCADGLVYGRVVGAEGKAKDGSPRAWLHARDGVTGPKSRRVGLYARRGSQEGAPQCAAAFGAVQLALPH